MLYQMNVGSAAFVVLSKQEQAARTGLVRKRTPTQCVRDDFLRETSLNAVLHWFLGGSTHLLSTGSAEEPKNDMASIKRAAKPIRSFIDTLEQEESPLVPSPKADSKTDSKTERKW